MLSYLAFVKRRMEQSKWNWGEKETVFKVVKIGPEGEAVSCKKALKMSGIKAVEGKNSEYEIATKFITCNQLWTFSKMLRNKTKRPQRASKRPQKDKSAWDFHTQ